MLEALLLDDAFLTALDLIDLELTSRVARAGCPHCGAALHRADFPRKPRGGSLGPSVQRFDRRCSLCCAREGCRRRATPPSVRFLGRRVYAGAVVIVAGIVAQAIGTAREVRRATGVPVRTVRRWAAWWHGVFVRTHVFMELRARLQDTLVVAELPGVIFGSLTGEVADRIRRMLILLAPLTTASLAGCAAYLRGIA